MSNKIYDLIITGAGPAGLMAAKTAAELGLSVCVIEKKKDFKTLNRACSMQFILDDGYEGERLEVKDGKLIFTKNHFEVPYSGSLVPVFHKYYHSPNNHIIHFSLPDEKAFALKFDKRALLENLYEDCIKAGVEFRLNTLAAYGTDHGDVVYLELFHEGNNEMVKTKKLIIAEGVNAHLATLMGVYDRRIHFATAFIVKYMLDGVTEVEPNSWNLHYGQIYHANSPVIIGPSLLGDNICEMTITGDILHKPASIFEKLLSDSPLQEQLKNATILHKSACTVKAFSSLTTPYRENVLAIGDTAAFVEVEVQGALMCGYHAAHAVLEEFRGNPGFEQYAQWWRDSFEFNSDEYLKVSQGYALVPTYSDDELDYLFGLIEDRTLEGTYSQYKTPKLIWDAIGEYSPQIKSERPEIYKKMKRMNQMTLGDSISR